MKTLTKLFVHFFPLLIVSVFFTACSSSKDVGRVNEKKSEVKIFTREAQNRALELFISGAGKEAKGDYAGAILDYQEALEIDPNAGIFYSLGKSYFALNRLSPALQNAKQAVELDSNNIDYLFLLHDVYAASQQNDNAISVLEKIIQLDANNISAIFRLAQLYEINRPTKAIELYNKILNIVGSDWTVLVKLSELYERVGDSANAIKSIEELTKLDPTNLDLQKILIEFYINSDNSQKAIDKIVEMLNFYPNNLELRELKAHLHISKNDWIAAAKEYNIILEEANITLETKIRIGASYFAASFNDTTLLPTVKKLFQTIDNDTTDWQVKLYLGAIAVREKNDSIAEDYFNKSIALAPFNIEGWIRLGGLYYENMQYAETIKLLSKAVENFPDDFAVNLILGLSYTQTSDYINAKIYLKKSIELNPNDISALSAYSYALSQLEEHEQAIIYINKALAIDPDNINLIGTLAMIYNSKKNFVKSDSLYSKALTLDSANATINNNFSYSLAERRVRLDEALLMAEIAIAAEPENSSFLDTIGWVHFQLGNFEKAKMYIEKAVEFGGDRSVILDHLGDVYYMLGKKEKAISTWQKAFDLDKNNETIKNKIEKGTL